MARCLLFWASTGDIPQAQTTIGSRSNQRVAIRRKHEGVRFVARTWFVRFGVRRPISYFSSAPEVPQLHDTVLADRGQVLAIGRNGNSPDRHLPLVQNGGPVFA